MVIELLKSYPYKKRQIEQLRFEMLNPPNIQDDEYIGSLALKTPTQGMAIRRGVVSDKTMAIALQYKDTLHSIKIDTAKEVIAELRTLEAELSRLEHYTSLLIERESAAIRILYFEKKSWNEAESILNVSHRTLVNYRNSAVNELTSMYEYLDKVKGTPAQNTS